MPDLTAKIDSWIARPTVGHGLIASDARRATAAGSFFGKNTADENDLGEKIYSDPNNLPTALASILNHSQTTSGFNPSFMSPEDLEKEFKKYQNQLIENPFIRLKENHDAKQQFHNKNYNDLIDQIIKLYDGISSEDADKIKDTITKMAKSVFSQSKSERWENLFVESSIDYTDPFNPIFRLYSTTLHMIHEKKNKSEVGEQEFTVKMSKYEILTDLIKVNAKELAEVDRKTVDQWIYRNTSPADHTVKLCF